MIADFVFSSRTYFRKPWRINTCMGRLHSCSQGLITSSNTELTSGRSNRWTWTPWKIEKSCDVLYLLHHLM